MTLCIVTGWQCNCQPDDGVTCTGPYELRQAYTHWRKLAEDRAEKVSELNSDLTAARLELDPLRRQNERLAAALFRHACYCGCGDPNPDLHRPDCVYRQAHG